MWRARFFQAVPKIQESYPTARWLFVTLTVRNCPVDELRSTLEHMKKSWDRFSKRKAFPALGFIKSVEVTRAKDGTAHPHFHCLLLVPSSYFSTGYISHAKWTELWQQALRVDYTPIVNVKAVKPRPGVDPLSALPTALLETLKYTVKPEDLEHDASWLSEITAQLHKTRAVSVGGVLRQFLSEDDPEDLIHAEGEDISLTVSPEVWFGWREFISRYAKVDRLEG
jgi:plasmid rolling circle replication initiator protein Rep